MLYNHLPKHILLRASSLPSSTPIRSHPLRAFASSYNGLKWTGSQPEEHVTQSSEKHNIQSEESNKGRSDRAAGGNSSVATSEKDKNKENAKAEEDHPEAPGPVIGMNDERGSKGHR